MFLRRSVYLFYLLCLFTLKFSLAQPVCQIGNSLSGDTVTVPSVGLFGYDGYKLNLLATGTKEVVTVKSFYPAPSNACIETINGKVYFNACESGNDCYMWESDGTPANTKKIFPVGYIYQMKAVYNRLYYDVYRTPDAYLYMSDGTSAGYPIASINTLFNKPRANAGDFFMASTGAYYKNEYYFTCTSANDGAILRIPAAKPDTVKIVHKAGGLIQNYVVFKDRIFFRQAYYSDGHIWSTDGTTAGTTPLWAPFNGGANPPFIHKDKLYFSAFRSDEEGTQIIASDGTVEGTISVVRKGFINIFRGISAGKYFYFSNATVNLNWELWRSDGTQDGTQVVKDIRPDGSGYQDNFNFSIIAQDSIVYFTGTDTGITQDVWRSDGTELGTYKIVDFGSPNSYNYPNFYFLFENNLYFISNYSTKVFYPHVANQYTVRSGPWNTGSTWSSCRVPLPNEPVEVNHTVPLPNSYKAYNLKTNINPAGKISFGSNSLMKIGN
ncbi:hypothetical protein GCM10027592_31950 [Spirosoma flavus]